MRIAIAYHDRLVREAIRRTLVGAGREAAWSISEPNELARALQRQPPDLVLLDAGWVAQRTLPELGVQCACLVLGSDEQAPGVYEALSSGALAHAAPPWLAANGEIHGGMRFLKRLERVTGLIAAAPPPAATPPLETASSVPVRGKLRVLALGASTGGPKSLARVLSALPSDLPAAVLIVQHIDRQFVPGLVDWLQSQSVLPVKLAQQGELAQHGRVYVADHQGHLIWLPGGQLGYLPARGSDLHAPSVDRLFDSLAGHVDGVAALLTGMGDDGARGLLALRKAGWFTVAQDEQSSPVYGMPRAAVECGAASTCLPLSAIGAELSQQLMRLGDTAGRNRPRGL